MKISPWAAGVMKVAVLSAAFAIPGTAIASASTASGPTQITNGVGSILGGNAVSVPVNAPVDICGNAVGLIGSALGACQGGASVSGGSGSGSGSGTTQITNGAGSIGGGNAVSVPVNAPVDACGNAVGNAAAHCRGGASVRGSSDRTRKPGWPRASPDPSNLPVTLCGNAVALLGQSEAACAGGSYVTDAGGAGGSGTTQITDGRD